MSLSSSSTTYPVGGGGGGGSSARVPVELMDQDKFVGYSISKDCLVGAKAIMANYGIQINDKNRITMVDEYRQVEGEMGTLSNTSQYMQGIDLINKELARGKPLIVGVDIRYNREPNTGSAADHFVVVTGRGYDEKGVVYYTYIETGVSDKDKGCNTSANRFYYNSQTNRWEDPTGYNNEVCAISQARGEFVVLYQM